MGSALLIDLGVFALCFGSFLAVMYFAFGFDDITSGELLQVAFNPQGLDAMGVLGWIVLSSLLAFLAVNAFTLFVSSRLRSSLGVVAISAAVALIPTIIRMFMAGGSFGHGFAAAEGNLLNWLRLCLPSGGVSLTGAMMDELTGCTLNLGAVFSPCWRGRFRFVDSGEGRRYNFDVKFAQFGRDGREWN